MATATERPYSNNGLLIGTGAAAPARSIAALTTGEVPVGITGYPPVPVRVAFPVTAWGAVGDGVTDDTTAINAAISAASAAGGGVVTFPPGTYLASQIVLKRFVVLDGGHVAAVELKQIGGTNADFIISENFAALTNSGHTVGTSALVPSWFGLKDIFVNGNSPVIGGTNTTGRGIAWYGNAQVMSGTVVVSFTGGDGIYTEGPTASNGANLNASEEGMYENVFVKAPGGNGWLFHGPHDSVIKSYICGMYQGAGWGFKNENGANYAGNLHALHLHVYSYGSNKNGITLNASLSVNELIGDGVSTHINATSQINSGNFTSFTTGETNLTVAADYVTIGSMLSIILAAVNNVVSCLWSGNHGRLGQAIFSDGSGGQASNVGLRNTGQENQFDGLLLVSYSGTGSIGIDSQAGANFARYSGNTENCKIGFKYDGGGYIHTHLECASSGGQAPVSGSSPGTTERFYIRAVGTGAGGTDLRVLSSNAIAMDSTTLQTITLAHTSLYTPTARNVTLTFTTPTVTDFVWAIPPYFVSASATTLTIKCKLSTASATAGSKGDVIAHVRMGA